MLSNEFSDDLLHKIWWISNEMHQEDAAKLFLYLKKGGLKDTDIKRINIENNRGRIMIRKQGINVYSGTLKRDATFHKYISCFNFHRPEKIVFYSEKLDFYRKEIT